MPIKLECSLKAIKRSYPIIIQEGIFQEGNSILEPIFAIAKDFVIISDMVVASLYGEQLKYLLVAKGLRVLLISFNAGEQHKTRATKDFIEDKLYAHEFGKDSCIIALGGGVVSDMAGFIAATYCRGLPLIIMPTTLLGMVDASIGGKTGFNLAAAKNWIGCVYQPKKVLIDPLFLLTLPKLEIKNGFVEMIKHAVIADAENFAWLDRHANDLQALKLVAIAKAIAASCHIKCNIIADDEFDRGKRHLLNFGHTVGHAIESVTDYTMPHGLAVALGMLAEGHVAVQLNQLGQNDFDQMLALLLKFGIPLKLPANISAAHLWKAMSKDKKSLRSKPCLVVLKSIGKCASLQEKYLWQVDKGTMHSALNWLITCFA